MIKQFLIISSLMLLLAVLFWPPKDKHEWNYEFTDIAFNPFKYYIDNKQELMDMDIHVRNGMFDNVVSEAQYRDRVERLRYERRRSRIFWSTAEKTSMYVLYALLSFGIGWLIFRTIIFLKVKQFRFNFKIAFWKYGKLLRLIIVFPIVWTVIVFLYIFLFNPFGYSISSAEWADIFGLILFPSLVLVILYFVYAKFLDK